jgi:hypothetical protein
MATVVNLAGTGGPLDYSYASVNRTTAADPNGALTPLFSGEIVLATTPKALYQAQGEANNTWVTIQPDAYVAT